MLGTELTLAEHLTDLTRHISLVRDACTLLGTRMIAQGRRDFGRVIIARGFVHDASKFHGIEFEYLHVGDVAPEDLERAIYQHVRTNSHHPEFHGGVENMGEADVAEMVCDWFARSQEFGTSLRDWITDKAVERYKIDLNGIQYKWINTFVDLLLLNSFTKRKAVTV